MMKLIGHGIGACLTLMVVAYLLFGIGAVGIVLLAEIISFNSGFWFHSCLDDEDKEEIRKELNHEKNDS